MTQNIYDNEEFFAGLQPAAPLGRGSGRRSGMAGIARPAAGSARAQSPRPRLRFRLVLPLGASGCRSGFRHRCLREDAGAGQGYHSDPRSHTPRLTWRTSNCRRTFDVVYSSLALHYVENLSGLLSQTHRSLVPGGVWCSRWSTRFSPRHPTELVSQCWPQDLAVDGYLDEGPRSTDWLAKGVVKQHRTLATYINMLIQIGFVMMGARCKSK